MEAWDPKGRRVGGPRGLRRVLGKSLIFHSYPDSLTLHLETLGMEMREGSAVGENRSAAAPTGYQLQAVVNTLSV